MLGRGTELEQGGDRRKPVRVRLGERVPGTRGVVL